MDRGKDEWIMGEDGQIRRCTHGQMDKCMNGWIVGQTDGWTDGCMDAQTCRGMDRREAECELRAASVRFSRDGPAGHRHRHTYVSSI